jgi:predicted DNA-binding protein (UPF0251 family)
MKLISVENEDFSDISAEKLLNLSHKYLTDEDTDFIYLVLHGRRTKEISMLLNVAPCEVVRRRRVLTRKIRVIYTYHYKYNYIEFIKFASKVLYPDQLQCLILHYVQLMSLQRIANHMGVQPSTAKRWLSNARAILEEAMEDRPELKIFLNSFEDLTYLNIKEIKRSGSDARKFSSVQVGKATLSQWATQRLVFDTSGNFKLSNSPA